MIDICLKETTDSPLYKQIVDQVRQSIATSQVQPGEHLPPVRQLAQLLHLNPGTVVKAYNELERAGLLVSRRGGGTVVSAAADNPGLLVIRQRRLSNMLSSIILEALSMGYGSEEIEAAFHNHLDRWREERKHSGDSSAKPKKAEFDRHVNTILIVGSDDLALNILLSELKHISPDLHTDVTYAGSLGGLIALQEGKADLAGIHLLDEETGEYNYPYVKRVLPGREMAIVHLAYRVQGLMFAAGNPLQIKGIDDLNRHDITFVNRQNGSGTRVLLDRVLRQNGIKPAEVRGYEHEMDTHLAVAGEIARGKADVGLGIQAAATTCNLGFLRLFRERYDLVIPMENYNSELLKPLLEIIRSDDFRKVINNVGGYDTSETGTTTFCR
jgi:molybdate-binding protein/DNA-binding transcriptional regulator YhcF (GntR family)